LRKAFIYSDNIYFAQTALDVGRIKYMEEAKKFGIGEKFPFDIPLTRESQLFNETINSEGQLANTAYGQAEVLMNPIHLATIYTLLVNDGNIIKPKLIYNESNSPEIWKSGVCSKEDADLMMKYLGEVVSDKNGTAHAAYTPGLSLAGKTGTAELKATRDQKVGQDNGWFIGIDTKNMDLEVCIFVEGVEKKGGSEYCVKKSKKIFEQFSKK